MFQNAQEPKSLTPQNIGAQKQKEEMIRLAFLRLEFWYAPPPNLNESKFKSSLTPPLNKVLLLQTY